MKIHRGYVIAAALGLAVLGAAPAHADLIVYCTGASGCGGAGDPLASNNTNTTAEYDAGGTFGAFSLQFLEIAGILAAGGNLADTANLEIQASGPGSINLFFTETNLTAGTAAQFLMNFTGNDTGFSQTRTFYLDPTNAGGTPIELGSCNVGTCALEESLLESLSGAFSITEDISITTTGSGILSSDDDIFIPEPGALSLFGVALLALGAFSRRRRPESGI